MQQLHAVTKQLHYIFSQHGTKMCHQLSCFLFSTTILSQYHKCKTKHQAFASPKMQGVIKSETIFYVSIETNTFSAHKPTAKQAYNDYISSITCCSNKTFTALKSKRSKRESNVQTSSTLIVLKITSCDHSQKQNILLLKSVLSPPKNPKNA